MVDESDTHGPSRAARERQRLVRVSPEVADIVTSLLIALFPDRQVYREAAGSTLHAPVGLAVAPKVDAAGFQRLEEYLHQLAGRSEWRARHALAREVSDSGGTYLELIVPVDPEAYSGGPALVGPFALEAEADEFGSLRAGATLSHDVFSVAGGWLTDLFEIPQAGWEKGSR